MFKLTNEDDNLKEENAVKQIADIFKSFSQNQIDRSFRRSQLCKFGKGPVPVENIAEDYIMAELDCRLEELALQNESQ